MEDKPLLVQELQEGDRFRFNKELYSYIGRVSTTLGNLHSAKMVESASGMRVKLLSGESHVVLAFRYEDILENLKEERLYHRRAWPEGDYIVFNPAYDCVSYVCSRVNTNPEATYPAEFDMYGWKPKLADFYEDDWEEFLPPCGR